MPSPWLGVPLEDYEGHMSAAEVGQLSVLADLFGDAVRARQPESVAILGIAGGNGLNQIDRYVTRRIVGVDIHADYLAAVQQRYPGDLPGLELHLADLSQPDPLPIAPVQLVHAALIFEHAGLAQPLEHALSLVEPGGAISVVLQLPSTSEAGVSATRYTSLQSLKDRFALIAPDQLKQQLSNRGFHLISEQQRSLPAGKAFWMGLFLQ
ncbi:hypothetical protein F183_A03120 [Bryobacterales bacterium F-183]|nr:hypothetical protein F183_A03120 [Bryobacterales bacterium F-183]